MRKGNIPPRKEGAIYRGVDIVKYKNAEQLPFEYVGPLGTGGFATVAAVRGKKDGVLYACKTFKPTADSSPDVLRASFEAEHKYVRALNQVHTNIVRAVTAYILEDTQTFSLILEPVASHGDLEAFLSACRDPDRFDEMFAQTKGPFDFAPTHTLLGAFQGLGGALRFVHSCNIRHRDLKPKNCLVHNGKVLLSDFGLAGFYERPSLASTGDAGAMTFRYCAPEVLPDGRRIDSRRTDRTDIFSLGCIFVEIVATLMGSHCAVQPWAKIENDPKRTNIAIRATGSLPALRIGRYADGIEHLISAIRQPSPGHTYTAYFEEIVSAIIPGMLPEEKRQRLSSEQLLDSFIHGDTFQTQNWEVS